MAHGGTWGWWARHCSCWVVVFVEGLAHKGSRLERYGIPEVEARVERWLWVGLLIC